MVIVSKAVTSVSVDKDLFERLKNDEHINVSGLFNDFVREYYANGSVSGLEKRIERINAEIETKEAELKQLRKERDRYKERLEIKEEGKSDSIEDAIQDLDMSPEYCTKDNPAIQKRAREIGVRPEKLAERLLEENQPTSSLSSSRNSR